MDERLGNQTGTVVEVEFRTGTSEVTKLRPPKSGSSGHDGAMRPEMRPLHDRAMCSENSGFVLPGPQFISGRIPGSVLVLELSLEFINIALRGDPFPHPIKAVWEQIMGEGTYAMYKSHYPEEFKRLRYPIASNGTSGIKSCVCVECGKVEQGTRKPHAAPCAMAYSPKGMTEDQRKLFREILGTSQLEQQHNWKFRQGTVEERLWDKFNAMVGVIGQRTLRSMNEMEHYFFGVSTMSCTSNESVRMAPILPELNQLDT